MGEQDIKTGNELIAKFMGATIYEENGRWYGTRWSPYRDTNDCSGSKPFVESMIYLALYERDWRWLIPVVEKIWKLCENRNSLFYFEYKGVTIYGDSLFKSNLLDCYSSVINFIKFYNRTHEISEQL